MNNPKNGYLAKAVSLGALALACTTAHAQTVLIDFGNDDSFRGASVVNPDENGNHWTSVWAGAFYPDVVDIDGNPTTIDFGFDGAPGGSDSFNGPAQIDANPPTDPANSVFDAAALGDLGADEAVYDYYVDANFQIQGLDPAETYNITFYGAKKFNTEDTTRYTAYTDDNFSTPIASVDLVVGTGPDHNTDTVVTLEALAPDGDGIIYIGFDAAMNPGTATGYLNAMKVERVPDIVFSAQPEGDIADPGGTLSFSASASGMGPTTDYQWRKDGVDLTDDARITGATTANLTITTVGSDDIGEYTVVATSNGESLESEPGVGAVRPSTSRFDVNGDGTIDFFDLADLLNVL